jgi:hypothetical protein
MTVPEGFIVWSVLAPALLLLGFALLTLLLAVFQADRGFLAGVALTGIAGAAVFALHLLMQAQHGGRSRRLRAALPRRCARQRVHAGHPARHRPGGAGGAGHAGAAAARPPRVLPAAAAFRHRRRGDGLGRRPDHAAARPRDHVAGRCTRSRPGAPTRQSQEAGLKYFLLGAFASALFIYGIALTYGAGGHFDYANLMAAFSAPGFEAHVVALLGAVLLLAGLGFKVALVPFHQWAPDVYTGAPTPVTAFMAVVVKAAAFGALLRIAATLFASLEPGALGGVVPSMLVVLVGATLIVGNLGALLQPGVKRMLAYSAVAHAGYLGLAVLAAATRGWPRPASTWPPTR